MLLLLSCYIAPAFWCTLMYELPLTFFSAVSVPFSTTCRSVFRWALVPAHIMTEPPPCSGAKRSFSILQDLVRLCVKSTQTLTHLWIELVPVVMGPRNMIPCPFQTLQMHGWQALRPYFYGFGTVYLIYYYSKC